MASWCRAWCRAYRRRASVLFGFSFLRPVLSIRSVLAGSFDFFVSVCGRVVCAVFVSSFSCVICWRRSVSFSISSRPSSRLPVSWGVSCLFFAVRQPSRLVHQFVRRFAAPSRPAARLVLASFIIPRCFALFGSSCSSRPSSRRSVSSSSSYFRFARRLVSTTRRASRVFSVSLSCYFLFLSLVSLVAFHDHGDGRRLVLSLPRGCVLVPIAIRHCGEHGDSGNGHANRRYEERTVFISSISPSGKDDEGRYE